MLASSPTVQSFGAGSRRGSSLSAFDPLPLPPPRLRPYSSSTLSSQPHLPSEGETSPPLSSSEGEGFDETAPRLEGSVGLEHVPSSNGSSVDGSSPERSFNGRGRGEEYSSTSMGKRPETSSSTSHSGSLSSRSSETNLPPPPPLPTAQGPPRPLRISTSSLPSSQSQQTHRRDPSARYSISSVGSSRSIATMKGQRGGTAHGGRRVEVVLPLPLGGGVREEGETPRASSQTGGQGEGYFAGEFGRRE